MKRLSMWKKEKFCRPCDPCSLQVSRLKSVLIGSIIVVISLSMIGELLVKFFFLLLGGTGIGFSVQKHHVEKLPEIRKPRIDRKRRFLIGDSIEGWADSIKVLMRSYFEGTPAIEFDFSDIRQKGSKLITSGGKAPGPEPLKICIRQLKIYS